MNIVVITNSVKDEKTTAALILHGKEVLELASDAF